MAFRENLLRKIQIDTLTDAVIRSMGAPGSGQRMDLDTMRELIGLGGFEHRRERDLDLYLIQTPDGQPRIMVLDNELKIYATTIEDIALRKSPTVKEMISIRNAIKILNDKDVVVSRKADTVNAVKHILIDDLDLSFTAADIDALVKDGQDALANNYADGVIEIIDLFAELLDFRKVPRRLQVAHHKIWGRKTTVSETETQWGPMVVLNLMQNSLAMHHEKFSQQDKAAMADFQKLIEDGQPLDMVGETVFAALKDAVMQKGD